MRNKHPARVLFLALILLVFGLSYTLAQNKVVVVPLGADSESTDLLFYLDLGPSDNGYSGSEMLTACDPGFKPASAGQLVQPNLRYDISRPLPNPLNLDFDGPPGTGVSGWVRTGLLSDTLEGPGSNCAIWTSDSDSDWGTLLGFGYVDASNVLNRWGVISLTCDSDQAVWCIQEL